MPQLTISGNNYNVEQGKRLVLAIEETGIPIGHRCGGYARCTTCQVKFNSGEPLVMTKVEKNRLEDAGLLGEMRLSCQITCENDMELTPLKTTANQPQWEGDNGPTPEEQITPPPDWISLKQ